MPPATGDTPDPDCYENRAGRKGGFFFATFRRGERSEKIGGERAIKQRCSEPPIFAAHRAAPWSSTSGWLTW